MGIRKTQTLKVSSSSITLEHLRWLVAESRDAADATVVVVHCTPGDRPFDSTTYGLEVEVEVA